MPTSTGSCSSKVTPKLETQLAFSIAYLLKKLNKFYVFAILVDCKIVESCRQGWKFCIFGEPGSEPKKVWEPKTQEMKKEREKKEKQKEEKRNEKKREGKSRQQTFKEL